MVGKACRQGHEGADHTMSTAGSRVMKVYAQLDSSCSSFYLVWNIRSWDDPTHMSLPFSRRALPRHTQKCVSQVISNPVTLTRKMNPHTQQW